MTNKKILLGMLVLVLVFGMTVVGCGTEWEDPVIKVQNGTTFQVKSVLIEKKGGGTYTPIKSDPAGISPDKSKSYQIAAPHEEEGRLSVRVTLIVTLSAVQEATITSSDFQISAGYETLGSSSAPWNTNLLLSGTDSDSLSLNEI